MSEVIADMTLNTTQRAPIYILSNVLQKGIFSNKSFVSYSDS